jgi:SagB-type dehydrogenase family enzyme
MPIEPADLASADAAAEREQDPFALPELFMEATRLRPHAARELRLRRAAAQAPAMRQVLRQSCKTYASSPRLALPDPRAPRPTAAFGATAAPQASPVHLAGPIGADDLSRLLFYAAGAGEAPGDGGFRARSVPSADGLHPLEAYVLAMEVEGVPPGIYHFNAWLHCLEAMEPAPADAVRSRLAACLPGDAGGAAAAVAVTATPARICAVHGDRGHRLLLMEAGAAGHALLLGARALGLAARPEHDVYEAAVERLLGIDGLDEIAVALHLVGRPAGQGGR